MLKIKNQKRDPLTPPINLSALYDISCLGHLDEVAVNQKEQNFTRRELKRDRDTFAKALLQLGIKRGDIITVFTARTLYDSIVIFLAANKLGAIVSFLDEKTPRATLLRYLDEFNSPLLVTYHKTAQQISEYKNDAKSVKHVINLTSDLDHKNYNATVLETFLIGNTPITTYANKYKGRVKNRIFGSKLETLISFTSGSTSGPKPMVFTNGNIVSVAIYYKVASKLGMWNKALHTWMSYVHIDCPYGFVDSILAPLMGGGELILTPDFDETNLDYYLAKNPHTIFGVPPLLNTIVNKLSKDVDISDLKSFVSGGERLDKDANLAAQEFFKSKGAKARVNSGYGVGEALGLITSAAVPSAENPDSVGHIPAGVHIMILDPETGEELGFGKTGILYVSGKHILRRYFNRPELDEDKIITIKGRRYVKTGDLAIVSPTGNVTLVGRATFFINNQACKVYYEIVRTAVSRSDLVANCYVVKQPDAKLGLSPCAFVVVKDGVPRNDTTRRQIIADASQSFYLGKRKMELKSHELPQKIVFLDELPLTRANKTDFRKLEKMAKEMAEKVI